MNSKRGQKCFMLFYKCDKSDAIEFINEDLRHILSGEIVESREEVFEKLSTHPVMAPFVIKLNIDAVRASLFKKASDVQHLAENVTKIDEHRVVLDHGHFHEIRNK